MLDYRTTTRGPCNPRWITVACPPGAAILAEAAPPIVLNQPRPWAFTWEASPETDHDTAESRLPARLLEGAPTARHKDRLSETAASATEHLETLAAKAQDMAGKAAEQARDYGEKAQEAAGTSSRSSRSR